MCAPTRPPMTEHSVCVIEVGVQGVPAQWSPRSITYDNRSWLSTYSVRPQTLSPPCGFGYQRGENASVCTTITHPLSRSVSR
eukprot:m.179583 g.179583  ORF g.179583 m.179583 type:complete len:82 (+) comp31981_c0_seq2:3215-3460(+)